MNISHEEKERQEAQAASDKKTIRAGEETLEAILERINGKAEQIKNIREGLVEWVKKERPDPLKCELHKLNRVINWDQSAELSFLDGVDKLEYFPCPHCVEFEKLRVTHDWLHKAGVPDILLHANLTNFQADSKEDKEVLRKAIAYSKKPKGFLTLGGASYGTGKGHLAVALLREAGSGMFITMERLMYKIRETYNNNRAKKIREQCEYAKLLVLDELGLSTGGADELPTLHGILEHRHGNSKKTVITGNFKNKDEFYALVGPRMQDRLSQTGYGMLWLTGDSKRSQFKELYFGKDE